MIDFESAPGDEVVYQGKYVGPEWFDRYGLTISAWPSGSNETVSDNQARLMSLDGDMVLIIQDPANATAVEPNPSGGVIKFTFDTPAAEVFVMGLLGMDGSSVPNGSAIEVLSADGSLSSPTVVDIPATSSSSQNVTLYETNVRSVSLILTGPGGIQFLSVCVDDRPSASPTSSPMPSDKPSVAPSRSPAPSDLPSVSPSRSPAPSDMPSMSPSRSPAPSKMPSVSPSRSPAPSGSPSGSPTGTVSGHLYLDVNGNGVQDDGEPDLVGVDIVITESTGATQVVTTDEFGNWTATVAPGETLADIDE